MPASTFASLLRIVVVLATLLVASFALATEPAPLPDPDQPPPPPGFTGPEGLRELPPDLGPFNYLRELDQIAAFLAEWQNWRPGTPDHGGMIEAESGDLAGVIQTDNTLEAIWVWSRYRELTGRTTYDANVEAAWEYCEAYPAWAEEGAAGQDYYRVHNCAWALTAALQYEVATGDAGYASYAQTCASYIRTHPLDLDVADPWYGRLNAFCKGWAAGNLYLWAEAAGNALLKISAVDQGLDVLDWLEMSPSRLAMEYWAMSSGTAAWGVCNSVFRDDPVAGALWAAENWDVLQDWQDWYDVPGYDWNSAWNVAYLNGHFALGDLLGGSPDPGPTRGITDALLSLDTDDDGGIMAETVDLADEDMCWVTSYLAKFGVDRLIGEPADVDAGVLRFVGLDDGATLPVGEPIPVRILATNFGLDDLTGVTVELTGDWGDQTWVRDLAFVAMDTITVDAGWLPPSHGQYTLTASTSLAGDEDPENDSVTVSFIYGEALDVPADGFALLPRPSVNPFVAATGLDFALARPARVSVDIFDVRGARVAQLLAGEIAAGPRHVAWNGRDDAGRAAPSGVYLYRVTVDGEASLGKLVKVR
jgi:hypothetical protein